MRGKSSSSNSRNFGLELDRTEKTKEPNLSGAYIRSLVKQLSSSRTRDPSNLKEHENFEGDGISSNRNDKPENSDQPQQHKKQVRRRLHTSRPYQERLLNMAEARREIVTALKFHRASMKQASEKQQLETRPEIQPFTPGSSRQFSYSEVEEARLKYMRHPQAFPNNYPSGYFENFSSFSPGFCSPYLRPVAPIHENLNFTLPSQTLGLNLNLQDFNYLDSTALYSSSSSASTSSSPLSAASEEIPFVGQPNLVTAEVADSGLHPAMDDTEMAEIRSIGEQYQMEWNDTLNLVNSAWWFKFLKSMDISSKNRKGGDLLTFPFEEAVEFPSWMNANENGFCSDDYVQDPALPRMDIEEIDGMDGDCMDIEEIDGMDGDWLA